MPQQERKWKESISVPELARRGSAGIVLFFSLSRTEFVFREAKAEGVAVSAGKSWRGRTVHLEWPGVEELPPILELTIPYKGLLPNLKRVLWVGRAGVDTSHSQLFVQGLNAAEDGTMAAEQLWKELDAAIDANAEQAGETVTRYRRFFRDFDIRTDVEQMPLYFPSSAQAIAERKNDIDTLNTGYEAAALQLGGLSGGSATLTWPSTAPFEALAPVVSGTIGYHFGWTGLFSQEEVADAFERFVLGELVIDQSEPTQMGPDSDMFFHFGLFALHGIQIGHSEQALWEKLLPCWVRAGVIYRRSATRLPALIQGGYGAVDFLNPIDKSVALQGYEALKPPFGTTEEVTKAFSTLLADAYQGTLTPS